jgi:PAS domain S-box-containing protein
MDAAQILKQSAGPAIATDSDNKIIAVNQAACQLLGLRAQHARGRSMHVLLQARDSAGNRLSTQHYAFHEMVSRSEPVRSFDIEVRRASGEPLRVAVSVIVVLEAETDEYELVYQLRPVYRRRKADEAIERLLASRGTADEDPVRLRDNSSLVEETDLTQRQLEILRLMARGVAAAEIASSLGISVNTVRTHVQRILRRLGVHSQLEAVAVAFRERLI